MSVVTWKLNCNILKLSGGDLNTMKLNLTKLTLYYFTNKSGCDLICIFCAHVIVIIQDVLTYKSQGPYFIG